MKAMTSAAKAAVMAREAGVAAAKRRALGAVGAAVLDGEPLAIKLATSVEPGSERDKGGIDGQPGGQPPGIALSTVDGTHHARTIEYRYYYPEADADEALYVRIGPWPLLWERIYLSEALGDLEPTPAARVRRKRLQELTLEEKEWMSMDRLMHPEVYEFGAGSAMTRILEASLDAVAPGGGGGGAGGSAAALGHENAEELLARAALEEEAARVAAEAARAAEARAAAAARAKRFTADKAASGGGGGGAPGTAAAAAAAAAVSTGAAAATAAVAAVTAIAPPSSAPPLLTANASTSALPPADGSDAPPATSQLAPSFGSAVLTAESSGIAVATSRPPELAVRGAAVAGDASVVAAIALATAAARGAGAPGAPLARERAAAAAAPASAAAAAAAAAAPGSSAAAPPLVRFDLQASPTELLTALYLNEGGRGTGDVGPAATTMALDAAAGRPNSLAGWSSAIGALAQAADPARNGQAVEDVALALPAAGAGGGRTLVDPGNPSGPLLDCAAPATTAEGKGWSRAATGQALVPHAATVGRLYATKLDALLPRCAYSRAELARIVTVPLYSLSKAERHVRRLLSRFHDNAAPLRAAAAAAAERTRAREDMEQAVAARVLARDGGVSAASKAKVSSGPTVGAGYGWSGATGYLFSDDELVWDEAARGYVYRRGHVLSAGVAAARGEAYTNLGRWSGVGAPFASARSAVPIPIGAPVKLRRLLGERSRRLQGMWDLVLAGRAPNAGGGGGEVSASAATGALALTVEVQESTGARGLANFSGEEGVGGGAAATTPGAWAPTALARRRCPPTPTRARASCWRSWTASTPSRAPPQTLPCSTALSSATLWTSCGTAWRRSWTGCCCPWCLSARPLSWRCWQRRQTRAWRLPRSARRWRCAPYRRGAPPRWPRPAARPLRGAAPPTWRRCARAAA